MDVTLTEDQEFFHETTVRFLSTECPLRTVRELATSDDGFARAYWRQGAELGWTSLLVAEDHGGGSISGDGHVDVTIVADAFGRHVAPGPLIPTNVVAAALSRSGSDEQRTGVLADLIGGEAVAAWCGFEHGLGGSSVEATESGGSFTLSGVSTPVEAAAQATHLLVTARDGSELRQFLVPADSAGVTIAPLEGIDMVRRFGRVVFAEVSVPASAVVGQGSAEEAVEAQLLDAILMQSAQMVGAAELAFDMTVEWAFDRYSFGRPLASYQELKHRFADMKMWLETSHALTSALAREIGSGSADASETASVTKAYLGHHLAELMQDCVQMHGGIGLTTEHDLHLFLRRVVVDRSLFGTPADHRSRIARLAIAEAAA